MDNIQENVIELLYDNNLDFRENQKLAVDITNLVEKYAKQDSISEAKAKLFQKDIIKKGRPCPVCQQNVKMYWKKIDSQMAYHLIKIHKLSKTVNKEYFHVENDLDIPLKVGGAWAKLRWWGLIEEKPKDADNTTSRTSGYWKITDRGIRFVTKQMTLPMYVKLYNGKARGSDGKQVTIEDCLADKFNYVELINNPLD
jgi:hypothetical protein